ncbi:3-hydroxybutyryl-CoA dehydrogenase [Nocardioides zeae]|uniref:3-hydroxybutyryl-CoA dehydrogenase n=1 Tax=Nocardioides zeae TaxID=1457234 RepID=A0ACC6IE98_9ACTN|nr:3-hydroxyacyl-CoA dehydrogenase family protein [Nocardioides zeae]MDR6174192.1 3-hydroxybutyryl-CoA dehydrogenase [Nocardioides zeae]MDR6208999.1 3-hydroxybutyryl-CoA dehydrogenase [Nocardioides zeae]
MSRDEEVVGVFGGGRMGAGIAHAFASAGRRVVVLELTRATALAAQGRIETTLRRAEELGTLSAPVHVVLERVRTTTDPAALREAALVVEAVPEAVDLKARVLAAIEDHAPDAWVATNTSSLSIEVLASRLSRPERLVGLHFFNPVPASQLVEVVVGPRTSEELVHRAQAWVEELGKVAVTVRDSPGFASSRLGVALALEAVRMVEEGVASADDIDAAMTLGYKHPLGPLRTTDLVGLDVRLAIAEHLAGELGERFAPPALLREKVAAGHLGRKSGQGFYTWG